MIAIYTAEPFSTCAVCGRQLGAGHYPSRLVAVGDDDGTLLYMVGDTCLFEIQRYGEIEILWKARHIHMRDADFGMPKQGKHLRVLPGESTYPPAYAEWNLPENWPENCP